MDRIRSLMVVLALLALGGCSKPDTSKAIVLGKSPEALFDYCTTLGDRKPDINSDPESSFIECHVWAADVANPSVGSRSHHLGAHHKDDKIVSWMVSFGKPTQAEVEEMQRKLMLRYGAPTDRKGVEPLTYTWRFDGWHAYFITWYHKVPEGVFGGGYQNVRHGEAFNDRRNPE